MEKELLEMVAQWKQAAQEMIQKSENGSRSEMVNQMLYACAEMVTMGLIASNSCWRGRMEMCRTR